MRFFLPALLLMVHVSSAQSAVNPMLQPAQMKSDFTYLRTKLEQTHPGLYIHQPKERMQRTMDSLFSTLQLALPFTKFYKKIAFLIAEVRCEHTYVAMGHQQEPLLKSWSMLPFQLYFSGPRPVVVVNGTTDAAIRPGDEVIAVNGRPIDSVLRVLYQYLPSDGFMTTSKDEFLGSMSFSFVYNQFIEQASEYEMVVRNEQGDTIRRKYSSALTFADINKNALNNPVNKPVLDASKQRTKARKEELQLSFGPEPGLAIMNVRSFSIDKNKFRQKIDGFFSAISAKGSTDLLIDLSYNGGGEEELAAYLMSYLISTPIKFMEQEYLIDTSAATLRLSNVPEEVRRNLYAYIDTMKDGKSTARISEYAMELVTMEPRANGFKGRVWLYVNGGTSSAASTFAAVAQSNHRATLIGEETAGSFSGGGTVLGLDLTLPASGIVAHTSIVYQVFATTGKDGNRGVIPDISYRPDYKSLLQGNDKLIELVMQHLH